MGKVLSIILGLIAMAGGILLLVLKWWIQFKILVAGSIPIILFFGGIIAFIGGISSLKGSILLPALKTVQTVYTVSARDDCQQP